jgi:hypothetical protein
MLSYGVMKYVVTLWSRYVSNHSHEACAKWLNLPMNCDRCAHHDSVKVVIKMDDTLAQLSLVADKFT